MTEYYNKSLIVKVNMKDPKGRDELMPYEIICFVDQNLTKIVQNIPSGRGLTVLNKITTVSDSHNF